MQPLGLYAHHAPALQAPQLADDMGKAPTNEPGLKSEFFYTMTATVAERWLTARDHG
ncbi:hypothetical protein GCM10010121_065660 [Streptomyces brasiliensis]|uniref:Uncharacterized protein n=1 Tax=Streptomyces brasiliensis TaxID=1954 RepID=A0A917L589_9ACTN|nr:hypothetical protein GCM10010121_065660 [Streptomyces brasiliensis]